MDRSRASAAALSGDERLDGWLWLMEGYTCDEPARQRKLLGQALIWPAGSVILTSSCQP